MQLGKGRRWYERGEEREETSFLQMGAKPANGLVKSTFEHPKSGASINFEGY